MHQEDISFHTADHVTLRGWFYKSDNAPEKAPCLVMAHGFSAIKEMGLNTFAEYFISKLPITCLVYDNRGFGASDHTEGQPRQEIIPFTQISDYSDAITYAQMRKDFDPNRIGIWGSSYSGGHVLWVDGWANFHRLIRPDFIAGLEQGFQADRHNRASGGTASTIPVVDKDPTAPSALPTADSYNFSEEWIKKSDWKNEVTVRSVEALREYIPSAHIHHISPTPLLMTVADNDVLTPIELAIEAYSRAREPKQLHILPGAHFDGYSGPSFERNAGKKMEFLKQYFS